jgi:hypothetical protein
MSNRTHTGREPNLIPDLVLAIAMMLLIWTGIALFFMPTLNGMRALDFALTMSAVSWMISGPRFWNVPWTSFPHWSDVAAMIYLSSAIPWAINRFWFGF